MTDEFELFKALQRVFNGMTFMMFYLEQQGQVVNVIDRENVERHVYENRFSIFSYLSFPHYRDYEEFVNERAQALLMSPQ